MHPILAFIFAVVVTGTGLFYILHLILKTLSRGGRKGLCTNVRGSKSWTTESKDFGYTMSTGSVRVYNRKYGKSHSRTYKTVVLDKPKGGK